MCSYLLRIFRSLKSANLPFFQDPTAVSPSATAQQASVIFNKFCESEYCNSVTAACQARSQIGQDCSADPDFVRFPSSRFLGSPQADASL